MECGQYVETHEASDNSMNERTCPAIFLRTNGNAQGGAFFFSLRTGQRLNRQAWAVLPMPDTIVSTVHSFAKTKIIGLPFHNRKKKLIEVAVTDVTDENLNSTGVIDEDTADETDSDTDDDNDDDNEDDGAMPGLQERDLYDSDSDDEEEEEEEEEEEDEQSAGVLDDESAGVEVGTVEEEEAEVHHVSTKGVPKRNTRTRNNRKVRQTQLDSNFVYTNYSSSLTHSQSHITRTIEHVHAMHALVNY
jgi:cobalamin biosynthesis protein CobT